MPTYWRRTLIGWWRIVCLVCVGIMAATLVLGTWHQIWVTAITLFLGCGALLLPGMSQFVTIEEWKPYFRKGAETNAYNRALSLEPDELIEAGMQVYMRRGNGVTPEDWGVVVALIKELEERV